MITRNLWNGSAIPALGLGCWAIGGPMYGGETSYGWGDVDDAQSIRAIHKAVDMGIRFFDTAATYGAGHSEALLGEALADRPDVLVGTKVGYEIEPDTRQITGANPGPDAIRRGVEQSLKRLRREHVDLVHLHLNSLAIADAAGVFDALGELRREGKVGAFGWSTDFPERATRFAKLDGFVSVQHAMNVFFRATDLMPVIEANGLLSINRSPLAMGLLTGKYDADSTIKSGDVRSLNQEWLAYFKNGKVVPAYAKMLDQVRELLQSDGRSLAQGAIGWLWVRSDRTLPIPGFKTESQVADTVGALAKGPLPKDVMAEIERVIVREPEGEARER
jgi:aryl-alcohol dehydrogenase-like predicted oxidoreductase